MNTLTHLTIKEYLIPLHALISDLENDVILVRNEAISSDRFGIAFPANFYSGCLTFVSLKIHPGNSSLFHIEIDGFISRMQKAYIEFDRFGKILIVGEELITFNVQILLDDSLEVSFQFIPFRTRVTHLYLYSNNL